MSIDKIQKGDVFVVRSDGVFPLIIRLIQVLWSKDNTSQYNHSGIVIDEDLTTFEAKKRVKEYSLWNYSGRDMAIYRPILTLEDDQGVGHPIPQATIEKAIGSIKNEHEGDFYPIHRLVLHLFRPLAKFSYKGKFLVCSELTAKYLWMILARGDNYAGTNVDMLYDEWVHWRNFKKVFVGVFPDNPMGKKRGWFRRGK